MIEPSFWKNKKVFVTGHTGFKGGWLCLFLQRLGAEVKGYSLSPQTTPSLFQVANVEKGMVSEIGDIRDYENVKNSMTSFNPDIIIHMAAQPLVRESYKQPIETYDINVLGTVKVLEAARSCSNIKAIINVTTDKCYENQEWLWGYRENEPMGGHDPYSSSKGCSELVTSAYRRSFMQEKNIGLATARAGNVIGGGDWSKDRLIPDILTSFIENRPVTIRNPNAIRPWQHVLDPLTGYLSLAQKLYEAPQNYSSAWNFGPEGEDAKTVGWILDKMTKEWPGSSWLLEKGIQPHEAKYLKLDTSKAKALLKWRPLNNLANTLEDIIVWHKIWNDGHDMTNKCLKDIEIHMYKIQKTKHLY